MSEDRERQLENAEPARFTRDTLLGCVGLALILLTLPLLWLAVSIGEGWLTHVLPLLAFGAAVGGAAVTLRVPAGQIARSNDPNRPLTRTGATPTIERPATPGNRASLTLVCAFVATALSGYGMELAYPGGMLGLALMLATGGLLISQGVLVAWMRLPAPALRWLRHPLDSKTGRQSATLVALGLITLGAALFLALLDGYMWGTLGLVLLVAILVFITPLARRSPAPRSPSGANDATSKPLRVGAQKRYFLAAPTVCVIPCKPITRKR